MTGGILQLVARGYDDTYIIKEPEITYFKIVYRRHTNFSTFPKTLSFNQDLNFGKIGRCRVKFLGDLLYKVYLAIEIPEINIDQYNYTVGDLINVLSEYDIVFNYTGNNSDLLYSNLLIDIQQLINDKITELIDYYNSVTNAEIKNATLLKLLNIAFKNGNCWEFPDLCKILQSNFKHNKLTKRLFDLFNTGKPQFAWVKELAHNLIDYVEVQIDGVTIDMHNMEIIRCDKIINFDDGKIRGYAQLIGNIPELYTYNSKTKPKKILYLPLNFWFSKHISSAIPLVAMPHSYVDIIVKFKDFADVTYCPDINFKRIPKLNSHIVAHYVYVEEEERKRLCENKLEYLIEKYEIGGKQIYSKKNIFPSKEKLDDSIIISNNNEYLCEYKLDFNFSTKQLFWIIKPYNRLDINDPTNKFNYDFINLNSKNFIPVTYIKLKFNGRDRETLKKYGFYQHWQPYKHYCSDLVDNLFLYNFALYPQMLQPSGTASFSKIFDSQLDLHLSQPLTDLVLNYNYKFEITCYALQYNILRFHSGMAGLAFT
jgi:hypothetical protein